MSQGLERTAHHGGSAPGTPGFNDVEPEWLPGRGAAKAAAPVIPAAESTLGSHPCVALSSAQVLPEWINRNFAANRFPANGDNPLDCVSHSRGSLQTSVSTSLHLGRPTEESRGFKPDPGNLAVRDYRGLRET